MSARFCLRARRRPMSAEGSADLLAGLRQRQDTSAVNAGEKMHRQAGVRLHQTDGGRPRERDTCSSSLTLNSTFQFDPMSLLSRPDLGSLGHGAQRRGWEERSHAQRQSGTRGGKARRNSTTARRSQTTRWRRIASSNSSSMNSPPPASARHRQDPFFRAEMGQFAPSGLR